MNSEEAKEWLIDRDNALTQREQIIRENQSLLDRKREEIRKTQEEIREKERIITQKEEELNQQKADLLKRENDILKQGNEIEQKKYNLDKKTSELEIQEKEQKELDQKLSSWKEACQRKEEELKRAQVSIESERTELENQKKALQEKAGEIEITERLLEGKKEEVEKWDEEKRRLEEKIARMQLAQDKMEFGNRDEIDLSQYISVQEYKRVVDQINQLKEELDQGQDRQPVDQDSEREVKVLRKYKERAEGIIKEYTILKKNYNIIENENNELKLKNNELESENELLRTDPRGDAATVTIDSVMQTLEQNGFEGITVLHAREFEAIEAWSGEKRIVISFDDPSFYSISVPRRRNAELEDKLFELNEQYEKIKFSTAQEYQNNRKVDKAVLTEYFSSRMDVETIINQIISRLEFFGPEKTRFGKKK